MTLTVKELENLTPDRNGERLNDGGGLLGRVRVSTKGVVSVLFYWRFRHEGKYHDYPCGTWKKGVSLTTLRKKKDEAAAILASGKNPNTERKLIKERVVADQKAEFAKIEVEKAALRTIEICLNEWYGSKEISSRKDQGAYIKQPIAKYILPTLQNVAVQDVTKVMVADILHGVAKTAPVMANRLHAGLNQFFKYCCNEREWIGKNPLDGTSRAKIGGKEVARERTLCDPSDPNKHELKELRDAMEAGKLSDSTKAVLWIMLGTACRIGEITQSRWDAIDLEARTWTIPAENSKNGKQHTVNLSDFTMCHFVTLMALRSKKSPWVLPATRGEGAVCVKSITKQVYDRQRETPMKGRSKETGTLRLSGGAWTPHDLRRTAATLLGHCGVLSEVIERCLNHTEQNKLVKIYQRQEPRQQMKDAWEMLGQRLETLLADSNVTVGQFSNKAA